MVSCSAVFLGIEQYWNEQMETGEHMDEMMQK